MERLRPVESVTENPQPIIDRLLRKRDLLRAGDPAHEAIKTALVIEGGGMRGVYAGGVVTGLKEAGMEDVFDYAYGVSSGSPAIAYFLSGQPREGTALYSNQLANKKFINLLRPWKILDVTYAGDVFRAEDTLLNQEAVRTSRTVFQIGVTDPENARCVMLEAKDPEMDIVTALEASCALPVGYNRTIEVKGKEYVDGSPGCGLPIDRAIKQGCDTILIVQNRPLDVKRKRLALSDLLLTGFALHGFSAELLTATLTRSQRYWDIRDEVDEKIRTRRSLSVGIIAPEIMPIKRFTTDKKKLAAVAEAAEAQTIALFNNNSVSSEEA
jgi:predicted patatin/cPLA2 family phospholipase